MTKRKHTISDDDASFKCGPLTSQEMQNSAEMAQNNTNNPLASGAMAKALFFSEGIMPEPQMTDWCFETWRAQHKAYLLRQSAAYMAWYGKLPAAEADYYWQTYTEDETLVTFKAAG